MQTTNRQGGVVLIVALIFLLVLSIAAMAAMRLATLEARMSAGFSERSHAQQLAEAALVQAETWLQETHFVVNAEARLCTSDGGCFSNQCTQGRCFFGSYELAEDDPDRCTLVATAPANAAFQNRTVWDNSAITDWSQSNGAGELIAEVLTLIEWRCFMPLDSLDATNADNRFRASHWRPLYRISAYTRGRTGTSRMLVQSLYAPDLGRQSWREVPILFAP